MRRVWAWVGLAVCALGLTSAAKADTPAGAGNSWWPFGKSAAPQTTARYEQPLRYQLGQPAGIASKPPEPSVWQKMR